MPIKLLKHEEMHPDLTDLTLVYRSPLATSEEEPEHQEADCDEAPHDDTIPPLLGRNPSD